MTRIAIFASGNGSNAENIVNYFQNKGKDEEVALIICNRREAGVYDRGERLGVPVLYVPKSEINNKNRIHDLLKEYDVNFIVLAGFMLMVPDFLLKEYPDRIINIHPSLLPKYGGKGMHGHHVHEAVVAAGEKESGITIHYVNEFCDEGEIIFQAKTEVLPTDSAADVEAKIHKLEKEFFPVIIDKVINRTFNQ